MAFLEIQHLKVSYDRIEAVKGIDLEVKENDHCIALVGSNGGGKYTLVNAITGLLGTYQGDIRFKGESLRGLSTRKIVKKRNCSMSGKEGTFLIICRSGKTCCSAPIIWAKNSYIDLDTVYNLFPRLKECEKQQAYTLSGGEAEMVAVGRALLANPQLLVLDELTLELPRLSEIIWQALEKIKDHNVKILLAEQNVTWSFKISEYVYVIREGIISKSGSRQELSGDEEIRQHFLGV